MGRDRENYKRHYKIRTITEITMFDEFAFFFLCPSSAVCFVVIQAAVEARVLVFEVAERHDIIVRLKNEINDMEQQLKQKDTHIQFKDEIIKKLRLQRRSYSKVCHFILLLLVVCCFFANLSTIHFYLDAFCLVRISIVFFFHSFKCPHDLSRTKLDSIDKVVDLIRTVSRDISPDPASKECDCYIDFYQEKENQTDDELCQSMESMNEYARKIEAQQAEIELLNAELDKKVCVSIS